MALEPQETAQIRLTAVDMWKALPNSVQTQAPQAQFLPQPLDTADPNWKPVLTQVGLQPFLAIRLTGTHIGGMDRHFQPRVLLDACRRSTGAPGLVAAWEHDRHLYVPTHVSDMAYNLLLFTLLSHSVSEASVD